MAKRYYLCDLIGDGQSPETAYRAVVQDYGVNHVAEFPPQNADGTYSRMQCLVLVNAANHLPLLNDSRIDPAPDVSLDVKVAAVHRQTMQKFEDRAKARGYDTGVFSTADGFRDVIRGLGRQLSPNFHEENFDVSE